MEYIHGGKKLDIPLSQFGGNIPEFMQSSFRQAKEDPADKALQVQFTQIAKLMTAQSNAAGYPIFKNYDAVKIRYHNSGVTEEFVTDLPVDESGSPHWKRIWYTSRFPKHWAEYERQMRNEAGGTPISMVVQDPATLASLKMLGLDTVEKLVLTEGDIVKAPQIAQAKERAVAYHKSKDLLEVESLKRQELQKELDGALAQVEELKKIAKAKDKDEQGQDGTGNSSRSSKAGKGSVS